MSSICFNNVQCCPLVSSLLLKSSLWWFYIQTGKCLKTYLSLNLWVMWSFKSLKFPHWLGLHLCWDIFCLYIFIISQDLSFNWMGLFGCRLLPIFPVVWVAVVLWLQPCDWRLTVLQIRNKLPLTWFYMRIATCHDCCCPTNTFLFSNSHSVHYFTSLLIFSLSPLMMLGQRHFLPLQPGHLKQSEE